MRPTLQEIHERFLRLVGVAPLSGVENSTQPGPGTSACQLTDFKTVGYHLDVKVLPAQLCAAAEMLNDQEFALDTITGVDWLAAGEMEIVYDFFHPLTELHVVLRTRVPRSDPEVPTISRVFPGANWPEREAHEFFGIRVAGHPNLVPLLLPEDATYHPLRKDFAGAA